MRTVPFTLVVLLVGCAGGPNKSESKTDVSAASGLAEREFGDDPVDPVRLRNHLFGFADRFNAELAGTGTAIAQRTDDPVVREQTIRWRTRFIPLMHMAIKDPDPRAAFLEAWTSCVRMQQYFETGAGKTWFGDQQQLAIDCARRLVADIVALGKEYFSAETIEKASKDVDSFSLQLSGDHVAGASIAVSKGAKESGGALHSVLSIPMSPVKGLQGVGDTPSSIVYAAHTASQLGQVVQGLPEQARWQMDLFLFELLSQQAITELRGDVDQVSESIAHVSESIASIAATAETLPQDVQKEVARTLEEASTTIKEVDSALATADKVVASIDETSKTLRDTAVALQATAETVDAIIKDSTPDPSTSEASSSGDDTITELLKTSEELHATAVELRGFIGDLESDKLTAVLDKVSRTSESTIDYTLKRVTITGLLLLGALLVAQLLYRLVATKVIRPAPR